MVYLYCHLYPAADIHTINNCLIRLLVISLEKSVSLCLRRPLVPFTEELHSVENDGSQQTRHSFEEDVLVLCVHGLIGVQLQGEGGVAGCQCSQDGRITLLKQ